MKKQHSLEKWRGQGQTEEARGQGNRKILTIDENTITFHGTTQ